MASSISTRRGDGGTGQILYGPRVSKASPRLEASGAVDELGAHLGLCRAEAASDELAPRIEALQRELFVVGAELGTQPDQRHRLRERLTTAHLAGLDAQVAELEALPGLLDGWALPGASRLGALLDVARTVCRRAERRVVTLVETGDEDQPDLVPYLNRLSDLLWLYARWYELRSGLDSALRPDAGWSATASTCSTTTPPAAAGPGPRRSRG